MGVSALRFNELKAAGEEFLAAGLLGDGWEAALDRLAEAAHVTGTVLMCYHSHQLKAAFPSAGLSEFYHRFQAGQAPFCSRLARIRLRVDEGFRLDHDDYTDAEIDRDPFYQEFAGPQHAFWNAVVKLCAAPDGLDHRALAAIDIFRHACSEWAMA